MPFRQQLLDALDGFQHANPTLQSLHRVRHRDDLLLWLYRYVTFNSIFAGCVSNLAGEVHPRTHLFRDTTDTWAIFADRSANIAARIFFAAEDEYSNHHQQADVQLYHHRFLAQFFLRSLAAEWNIQPDDFQRLYALPHPPLDQTLQAVLSGYCVNQTNTEAALLRGIGFHLGSEHLADGEFCTLDHYLRTEQPDLVAALRKVGKPNAYTWVAVHTIVEAEHAEHALLAATEAAHFYHGDATAQQAQTWMLEGIAQFAAVQQTFFAHILD